VWRDGRPGFAAVFLGAGGGFYAVQQVRLARVAIDHDREARAEDRRVEAHRVPTGLLLELHGNRLVALRHEGRLRTRLNAQHIWRAEFTARIYDGAVAGPLWSVSGIDRFWPTLAVAYRLTDQLSARLTPYQPLAIGGAVGGFMLSQQVSDRRTTFFGGLFGFALLFLSRHMAVS
jgi:hypothetical protein